MPEIPQLEVMCIMWVYKLSLIKIDISLEDVHWILECIIMYLIMCIYIAKIL